MRKYVITIVSVLALIPATDANAHLVAHHPKNATLRQIAATQSTNLKHVKYVCRYGRRYEKRWSCAAKKWLTREYNETQAKLHTKVATASHDVGHYSGWACITNGAYPGAAHEGNGYNGLYTGPLGMSTPWAGYRPPTGDWVTTPVPTVYAIAEKVAASYGWADWWMRQQWPETYPPCAGHFN